MQAFVPKHADRGTSRRSEMHRQRRAPQLGICLLGLGDCDHPLRAPTSSIAASTSIVHSSSLTATPSIASSLSSAAASASSTASSDGPKGLLDLNIDLGLPLGLDLDLPIVGKIHLGPSATGSPVGSASATSTPAVKVGIDLGGLDVLGVKLGGGNAQPQGADGSSPAPAPITTALSSGWRTSTTVRSRPTPQSPAPAPAPPPSAPAPAPPPSSPAPPPPSGGDGDSSPAPPPSSPAPPPSNGGDGNNSSAPPPSSPAPPPSSGGEDGNSPAPPPSSPAPPPSNGGVGDNTPSPQPAPAPSPQPGNSNDGNSSSPPPASGGSGAIDNGNGSNGSNGGDGSNGGGSVDNSGNSGGSNSGGTGSQSGSNGGRPNGAVDTTPRSFTRVFAQPVASATIVTSVTTTNAQGQTIVAPTTLATLVPATVQNGVTIALSGTALSSALASNEGLTIINGTPVLTGVAAPTDSSTPGSSGGGLNVQALAGGIIGGILALCALILLYYMARRRKPQQGSKASLPPMSQIAVESGVGNTTHTGGGYSAPVPAAWTSFTAKEGLKPVQTSKENLTTLARKNTGIGRLLPAMRRKRESAASEANSFHCRDVDRDSWSTIAASPAILDAPLPGLLPDIANDLSVIPAITMTAPSTMSHASLAVSDDTPRASLSLVDFAGGASTPVAEGSPALSEASSFGYPHIVEEIGVADGGSDQHVDPFHSAEDAGVQSAAGTAFAFGSHLETLHEDRPESLSDFGAMMTSPFEDPPSQRSSIDSFATGLEEIQSEDSHISTFTRSSVSSGISDSTVRAAKDVTSQFPIPGERN